MPARTGAQYLAGLRQRKTEVWLRGERVGDVTTHPGLASGAPADGDLDRHDVLDTTAAWTLSPSWAANSAQDAMGFSTAIRNAHSHHMVLGIGGVIARSQGKELPKRMPGVEQALKKIQKK